MGNSAKTQVILFLSYIILFSGISQLIVSGIAISNSSAFGAAWYTGLSCIFSGSQGARIGTKQELTRRFVKWIFAAALFSTVFSIFGAAFDGTNFLLFDSFKACAEESTVPACSNVTVTSGQFFACVGEDNYFDAAVKCQEQDNSGTCSCVSSDSSSDCQKSIDGFPTCLFIITEFVTLLKASFILCLCCLISSGLLLGITAVLWCCADDLRDSTTINDSLVLSECPAVIPADAEYATHLRPSQIPFNISFVEVRPLGEGDSMASRNNSSSSTGKQHDIFTVRPSNVHEVPVLQPGPNDAIATPVITAVTLSPINR